MKKGWQTKSLGEVFDIERGGSPRPIENFITDAPNGINWIKISDATASDKYIIKTRQKIKPEGAVRSRIVHEGDFLLSNSMSFGRPYIMKTTGCIHDGWLVLREKMPNIDKDFIYHLLGSNFVYRQFDSFAAGSTVRNLNIELVRKVIIPIPPLPEQQRIVAILDEAFAGIATAAAHAEKNLSNARALFDSYLQNVKAEKQSIGELVNITTGKIDANAATENGEYPFFTCSRVVYAIDRFAFDCEAVLLAGNNASGDFNVKHYKGKFNAYQRTYVITINKENKLLYRYLYFQMLNSLKEFKNKSVGANTKFLKLGMIKGLEIPLPSFDEQQYIVATLDELSAETQNLEALYQQKLNALAELKKSILHQAFTGKLV